MAILRSPAITAGLLHFVLLIKLDRAIHARCLHTLAMPSNTHASCVHTHSFMVCEDRVQRLLLRSHTLSLVCLTLVDQAGVALLSASATLVAM